MTEYIDRQFLTDCDPADEYDPPTFWTLKGLLQSMGIKVEECDPGKPLSSPDLDS